MIDYSALLYDPVYAELGVPATLSTGTAGEITLTVIDDTQAEDSWPAAVRRSRSVGPGAFARIPELPENGIARDDYVGRGLTFNGRTWVVRSYELRGNPNGEDVGEVRFLLKAAERWLTFARTSWRGCWRWSPPFRTFARRIATMSISPRTSCRR